MTYNVELVELTKASFKSRDPPAERSSDLIGPTQPAIADKQEEQVRDDLPKKCFLSGIAQIATPLPTPPPQFGQRVQLL